MIPATAVFLLSELQSEKRRKSLIPERKPVARKVGKKVTLVISLQSLMMIKSMNIFKKILILKSVTNAAVLLS